MWAAEANPPDIKTSSGSGLGHDAFDMTATDPIGFVAYCGRAQYNACHCINRLHATIH